MITRLVAAAAVLLFTLTGAFAQDGPRAFHLVPEDTRIFSLTTTLLSTETPLGEFNVGVLTPAYRQTFDFFGNVGAILIGMPVGSMSASLGGGMELETDIAHGDLFIGGLVGLVGSPSLSPMEYAQHKPGFRAGVAAKLFLPTGEYESSEMLNLGTNRWSLHAALPISYVLGDTMLDPDLTTFELVPVVEIYGDNEEPFGGPSVTGQAPIWGLQGHVTRNFGPSVWASVDAYYAAVGETSINGVDQDNAYDKVTLGATLGLVLSQSLSLRLSYEEQVYSSATDTSARGFKASGSYRF